MIVCASRDQFRHVNRNVMTNHSSLRRFFLAILLWTWPGRCCPAACEKPGQRCPNSRPGTWSRSRDSGWAMRGRPSAWSKSPAGRWPKCGKSRSSACSDSARKRSIEVDYSDTETPDGVLIDFELVMKQGTTPMRTTGKVVGGPGTVAWNCKSSRRARNRTIPSPGRRGPEGCWGRNCRSAPSR